MKNNLKCVEVSSKFHYYQTTLNFLLLYIEVVPSYVVICTNIVHMVNIYHSLEYQVGFHII